MITVVIIVICVVLFFFIGISLENFTKGKKNIKKTDSHYLNVEEFSAIVNMFPSTTGRNNRFNQYLKFLDPIIKILGEKLLDNPIVDSEEFYKLEDTVNNLSYFKYYYESKPSVKESALPHNNIKEMINFIDSESFTTPTPFFNMPFLIYVSIFKTKVYSPKNPLDNKELQEINLILNDENNIKILLSSKHYKEKFFQKHISPIAPDFIKDLGNLKSWGFGSKSEHTKALENERKKYNENIENLIKGIKLSPSIIETLKLMIFWERKTYVNSLINESRG